MASTLPLISRPGLILTNHKLPLSTRSILRAPPYSSSCGPRRHFTLHSSSASSSDADCDGDLRAQVPTAAPGALASPMRRLIAAAPATIVPHLCTAASALLGCGSGDRSLAADAARALDIARAALHARIGGPRSNSELLAGDALLPLAFEILARGSERAHLAALRAVLEVADAIGASGAAGGYCMEAEGGEEDVERVVELTDGRVGECAAACCALAAAAEEEEEEEEGVVGRVRRFGYYAGMMDGMLRRGAAAAAKKYKERAVAEVAGGRFDAAAATAAAEWWRRGTRRVWVVVDGDVYGCSA